MIDWNNLILNAAYRYPPFERGDTEKGFRDAMIAEAFLQLMESSPKTPRICRLALVSADKLLRKCISSQTEDRKNIRLPESLDDLESLINTLVSEATERFVSQMESKAEEYFYLPDDKSTLYYREGVLKTIRRNYAEQLHEIPEYASFRRNGPWSISPPRFVSKKGQKISWLSRIEVAAKAFIRSSQAIYGFSQGGLGATIIGPSESSSEGIISNLSLYTLDAEPLRIVPPNFPINQGTYISGSSQIPMRIQYPESSGESEALMASGRTRFDVNWSVSVSTKGNLSRGKILSIEFSGTNWI